MAEIIPTTALGRRKAAGADLKLAKAQAALDNLDTHITTLQGSPTNAQVIAAVVYALQVEKKVIKYLMNAIDD